MVYTSFFLLVCIFDTTSLSRVQGKEIYSLFRQDFFIADFIIGIFSGLYYYLP
ncbi:hypothetical protein GGR08_000023 [Bartonella fuyuanensis]|uniref:Uncharacterized protein n=1 Tax=Bartonella fuyuanensis TaxID=1460968 RepID=A0A840DW35_9HYPH|nr:hypothetical protein [Bartonella fuyuanensis]